MGKGFQVVFDERQEVGQVILEDEEGREYNPLPVVARVIAKFDKQEQVLLIAFGYEAGETDNFLSLKDGADLSFYHGSHSAMMRHIIGGADHWYELVREGLHAYEVSRYQRKRAREYAAARGR